MCDLNKIEARKLTEFILAEQFADTNQTISPSRTQPTNANHQHLFGDYSFYCGPTDCQSDIYAVETSPGEGNKGNGDGDGKFYFWQLLKAHYIDHTDDNSLVAIVKTGNSTKKLH